MQMPVDIQLQIQVPPQTVLYKWYEVRLQLYCNLHSFIHSFIHSLYLYTVTCSKKFVLPHVHKCLFILTVMWPALFRVGEPPIWKTKLRKKMRKNCGKMGENDRRMKKSEEMFLSCPPKTGSLAMPLLSNYKKVHKTIITWVLLQNNLVYPKAHLFTTIILYWLIII